jgi:hypothetical protein
MGFEEVQISGDELFVFDGVVSGEENSDAVSAVLTALRTTLVFPSGVRGPVLSWELA